MTSLREQFLEQENADLRFSHTLQLEAIMRVRTRCERLKRDLQDLPGPTTEEGYQKALRVAERAAIARLILRDLDADA